MFGILDHTIVDETLTLILKPRHQTAQNTPLEKLFHVLKNSRNSHSCAEAEDLIWALWCNHKNDQACRLMRQSIGALSRSEYGKADLLLTQLLNGWPKWAEVWNKRATLKFLLEDNVGSVEDIQQTLLLEPRHFGAICGFGQICLRIGETNTALIAFESAIAINPNLHNVLDLINTLRKQVPRTLH